MAAIKPPSGSRLCFGLALGVAVWLAAASILPFLPAWVRFTVCLAAFTLGPASLLAGWVIGELPALEQALLLCALGVGLAPALGDVLARLGLIAVFPYFACAGVGIYVVRAWSARAYVTSGFSGYVASGFSRMGSLASLLPIAIALLTGALVFGHRLQTDTSGLTVFGDYDSVDLSYYAAVTAELTHRVPPMAPFYSGHPLNYAWYPQLLLALIHRFADVSILDMYFRYAWPGFLAITAAAAFLFTRSISSSGVALLATSLILLGGDFSYVFVWLLRPTTYLFDWLLWPTNFLAPTMEVLHFSTWTPSLPVLFAGLYALARAEAHTSVASGFSAYVASGFSAYVASGFSRMGPLVSRQRSWLILSAVAFALLVQFKPFAFGVLMAALAAAVMFGGSDRATRRRFAAIAALSLACALPFLYQIVTLYAESRSHLKIDFFLLHRVMLDKLALSEPLHRVVSRLVPTGPAHTAIVLAIATVLFFVGGLGVRWIGVPAVGGAVRPDTLERPIWRLLAWMVVAGVAIPFVIVTDPYQDSLQCYQAGLFVLWLFAARTVVAWKASPVLRAVAIAASIALAVPSSIHYLLEKRGDGPKHPLIRASLAEMAVADYLRQTDPERTVILHDRPLDPSFMVITSERRAVLAWRPYVTVGGSEARRREVDRFFASAEREPPVALDVLRQYNVTHVIEHPGRDRVNRDVLARLRPVLTFPDVVLYEVPPGT